MSARSRCPEPSAGPHLPVSEATAGEKDTSTFFCSRRYPVDQVRGEAGRTWGGLALSLGCFSILKTQESERRNAWWDCVARGFREGLSPGGGMAGDGASQRPAVGNGPDRVAGTGARVSADGEEQEPRPPSESGLSRDAVQGAGRFGLGEHMTPPSRSEAMSLCGLQLCKRTSSPKTRYPVPPTTCQSCPRGLVGPHRLPPARRRKVLGPSSCCISSSKHPLPVRPPSQLPQEHDSPASRKVYLALSPPATRPHRTQSISQPEES